MGLVASHLAASALAPALAACAPPPPQLAPAPGCLDGSPRLETVGPDRGPYPSLDALCAAHLASDGNDAPRICEIDVRARIHDRHDRFLPPSPGSAIRGARIIARDHGGDFVGCDLAVQTARGWYGFDGVTCDNSMNDDDYSFTSGLPQRFTRPDGADGLLLYFTAIEQADHGGTFLWVCRVDRTGQPACALLPSLVFDVNGVHLDFYTSLDPDGLVEVGALGVIDEDDTLVDPASARAHLPSSIDGLTAHELIARHRPGRYCP